MCDSDPVLNIELDLYSVFNNIVLRNRRIFKGWSLKQECLSAVVQTTQPVKMVDIQLGKFVLDGLIKWLELEKSADSILVKPTLIVWVIFAAVIVIVVQHQLFTFDCDPQLLWGFRVVLQENC
jgi:hypothetical protein